MGNIKYEKFRNELTKIGKDYKKNNEITKSEIALKIAEHLTQNTVKIETKTICQVGNGYRSGLERTFKNFWNQSPKKIIDIIFSSRYSGILKNRFSIILYKKENNELKKNYISIQEN